MNNRMHVTIYFLGKHRCASFSGNDLATIKRKLHCAMGECFPEAYRRIVADCLDGAAKAKRRNWASVSIEYGTMGAAWRNRASTGDIERISRDMPECPGLDYRLADSTERALS